MHSLAMANPINSFKWRLSRANEEGHSLLKPVSCLAGEGSNAVDGLPEAPSDEDITQEGLAMWQHIAAASSRAASEPEQPAPTDAGADAAARIWADIQSAATRAASEPDFPELSIPSAGPDQLARKGNLHSAPPLMFVAPAVCLGAGAS